MSDRQSRPHRPMAIPIRVFLSFLGGIGVIAVGMRMGQTKNAPGPLPGVMQIGGLLLCLWALYEGTRSVRLKSSARPVRKVWGNREVAVTSEGLVFFIILITTFIAAFLGKSNLLLLVFAFLAATFVLNGAVTNLMLDKNHVRRRLPRNIMAGETLAVEVTLENRRRRLSSWLMVLQDQISNSREILHPRVLFRRIPARSARSGWYQVRFGQRGVYHFGPLKLITRFPLGFVERGTVIEEGGSIIVHPRVGRLTPTWRSESADAEDLMRHRRSRFGTHDDDFHRLREYRTGDNPKAIHWLTSARKSELMVREYHETRDRDLIVLLDLQGTKGKEEFDAQVERAVSFAATLMVDHCRRNRGAGLAVGLAGKSTFFWRGSSGPNAIPHLLDELASLESGVEPGICSVARKLQDLQWSKSYRILVTTRRAAEVTELLENGNGHEQSDARHPFRVIEASPEGLARLVVWE